MTIIAPHVIDSIQLYGTPTIGMVTYHKLVRQFGDARGALHHLSQLPAHSRPAIMPRADAERIAHNVANFGGRTLTHTDSEYPTMLKHSGNCPPYLHVMGNIALLNRPTVAIVGARNASVVGQRIANEIATHLGNAGYVIASGLARGIDTSAHVGSLKTGTIAVIAGGLDSIYPPENANLHKTIAKMGCLVTEQPIGTKPRSQDFPKRNGIIAGLCRGLLVAECAVKSGAMITARHALDLGRDVFAVPGSPADIRARGCNQLIKDGAGLAENADDIIHSLQAGIQHTLLDPTQNPPLIPPGVADDSPPQKWQVLGMDDVDDSADGDNAIAPTESTAYTNPESEPLTKDIPQTPTEILLTHLSTAPTTMDELVRAVDLPLPVVQSAILELELNGKITRHGDSSVSLI